MLQYSNLQKLTLLKQLTLNCPHLPTYLSLKLQLTVYKSNTLIEKHIKQPVPDLRLVISGFLSLKTFLKSMFLCTYHFLYLQIQL